MRRCVANARLIHLPRRADDHARKGAPIANAIQQGLVIAAYWAAPKAVVAGACISESMLPPIWRLPTWRKPMARSEMDQTFLKL
jgi:hypothetical protein